ncbi:hypothetical protein YUWDRAFT_07006 [Streptomyces sp. AmelKG-D3]|nr:hypothetical protein YUWDRAFT_07006 [Streptomyces sp. AmelKG-D3]
MPEWNIEFGAQGVKGHKLVARRLDPLAGFIASPVTTRRGLTAREAGLTIRSKRRWRAGAAPRRVRSARSTPPTDRCTVRTSPATSWPT